MSHNILKFVATAVAR